MTPNKLAVYSVADMVVADIDFPCGRDDFFAVAHIVLLWPIWFVADTVAPLSWWRNVQGAKRQRGETSINRSKMGVAQVAAGVIADGFICVVSFCFLIHDLKQPFVTQTTNQIANN